MTGGPRRRDVDRLVRLCEGTADERTMRVALIAEMRRVVDFDAYAWLLTDPETEVGCAPLAEVPATNPARARVRLADGRWVTMRASRVLGADGRVDGEGDIAVTIEACTPSERRSLFALCHGLSPREIELLALVADGASTREIAGQMLLSENTVQDHLKSVFTKTGLRNRRALVAAATGL